MKKGLFVGIVLLGAAYAFAMERPKRSLESDVELAETAKKPKASQQTRLSGAQAVLSVQKEELSSLDWNNRLSNFDAFPVDIKRLILEKVIASSKKLDEAIGEIKKIRLISKASNAFISSPSTLQWLISKLANDFSDKVTEQDVFNALKPLTNSAEMQVWLEKQKPFITWKYELWDVFHSKDLNKLKELLEQNQTIFKKDLNDVLIGGDRPLIIASGKEWLEAIPLLLSYGANPNLANPDRHGDGVGVLPLNAPMDAVGSTEYLVRQKPVIELLLKLGANINAGNGRSHLMGVISGLFAQSYYDENDEDYIQYYDYIKYLLEAGANPNIRNDQGMTPLLIVLLHNFRRPDRGVAKLVKLLMNYGADPDLRLSVSAKDIYYSDDDDADGLGHLEDDQIAEYFTIKKILDKKD